MQSKKKTFFNENPFFFKHRPKKTVFKYFFYSYLQYKGKKVFLILWSAYSCYIQVVKHYIQYVNCIFIDSETNYLMNYNTVRISIAT